MDKVKSPLIPPSCAVRDHLSWKSRKAPFPIARKVFVPPAIEKKRKSPVAEAIDAAASKRKASLNILVADDNAVNRQLVRLILEKEEFKVALASNGSEVLTALLEFPFDIVIMDVQMPEMDGLQATAAIRSGMVKGIDAQLPVIAVSANSLPEDRLKCLQAGMTDFVPKPLSSTELLAMVRKYGKISASDAPAPVVDRQQVLDRLGDPELLELVCSAFVRDTPDLMRSLRKAVEEGTLSEAERYAHSLKGYAANIGAEDLRRASLDLETAAERGNGGGLPELLTEVGRLVEAVMEILRKEY